MLYCLCKIRPGGAQKKIIAVTVRAHRLPSVVRMYPSCPYLPPYLSPPSPHPRICTAAQFRSPPRGPRFILNLSRLPRFFFPPSALSFSEKSCLSLLHFSDSRYTPRDETERRLFDLAYRRLRIEELFGPARQTRERFGGWATMRLFGHAW